jgi:hypothetical protein
MSDLQWALLGSSVVAIVCVWLYNVWQERKFRKATDELFKKSGEHALGGAAAGSLDMAAISDDLDQRIEPRSDSKAEGSVADGATTAGDESDDVIDANEYAPWGDAVADCLVRFDVPPGVAAPAIWASQSTWSSELSKPLCYLARGGEGDAWQLIGANDIGFYTQWLAVLQLADRQGALSDRELTVFFDGLQQLATQLNATVTIPGRSETLQRAQQLDDFCAGVDVQFSLHVIEAQGGSFAGTKLRGVCEAAGLTLKVDGCFHAIGADGATEYVVRNSGSEVFSLENLRSLATNGLTLTLDVPRAADGVGAFDRMVGTARQLERGLGGKLVDAQRAPLAEALILGIRQKILELQTTMHGAGMPPGGELTSKLFSG